MIQAVAFDLDGLLVSSEDVYLEVGVEILGRRGKTYDDGLRNAMMGRPTRDALQVMVDWHQLEESLEAIAAECETLFWQVAENRLTAMPGVGELLTRLDQLKIPYGVATSGTRSYAERVLTSLGIRPRLKFVLTADDVTRGKPAPDVYLLAAEQHRVAPPQMLVLEDSANGCRAGLAAGAHTVAVPNAHTADHDFTGVALVANTLRDERLLALLAGLNR